VALVNLLVVVRRENAATYYKNLSAHKDFRINLLSDVRDAWDAITDREKPVDAIVLDNAMPKATDLVSDVRFSYPRILIVLVDEEADIATPGQADDITTEPFKEDDLIRRITRLMSDRRLETLRADAMPPVREFAKKLRSAAGEGGKTQAAVTACHDLGYDYTAFYRIDNPEPLQVSLRAQEGTAPIQSVAPRQASDKDLIGWVAKTGQSKIAGPDDELTHPLVKRGRLGAVACVAVGATKRYGVLVACRDKPGSISGENLVILELVSAQLAAVIAKDSGM